MPRSPLRVTGDGHFFCRDDGSPFFYLADTAWMLPGKLTLDEADRLLADRAAKGFTVVQACVFRDLFAPNTPNALGDKPFATDADMRAVRLNPKWTAHVQAITRRAAARGLTMAWLPTWGDKWNEHSNSAGPVIMDQTSAARYCRQLSDDLAVHDNVIWVLGGDSPVQTQAHADTIRAMAGGLRDGGSGDRLITFHPSGQESSAIFHAEPWLDFNATQSSHYKPNFPNYTHVERLHATVPPKPVIDAEPNYEGIPMFLTAWHGFQDKFSAVFSPYDVRKSYYRAVLAGAAGHTHGAEPIRQIHRRGDDIHGARGHSGLATWDEALSWQASSQLRLLKDTLLARNYFARVPAQELLRPYRQTAAWPDHMNVGLDQAQQTNVDPVARISVARQTDGGAIFAYMPVRQTLYLDVSGLRGDRLRLSLFDPETGEATDTIDFDRREKTAAKDTYSTRIDPGMMLYVPRRDLDTFFVVDALD